ncbi:hypothetical protein HYPSUDRAFT_427726 [Hypholoma sublateritium FD-334 SS-4]|uniref:Uncharacterized protein n=1 Tax=Hypholoma sublateritium (strain FD-334 SS-4) TaxID=945553 RepID=A0A0D2LV84_HYPSF|nr:hypothetical protein HYPSUDRAFT_427726 [Hypholoma sublateritium FD-334 SS-4]
MFEFTAISSDDPDYVGFGEAGLEGPEGPVIGFLNWGWSTIPSLNDGTTGLSISELQPNNSASIVVDFTGTSLTWVGFTYPGYSVSGTYSIDSQAQSQIRIRIPPANNQFLQPGRVYFQTPLLDIGDHKVSSEYTSSTVSHQMSIQKFIIGNGTVPADLSVATTATTPSIPPSGTSSMQTTAPSTRPALHRPVPVIVGVIAGVSVVAFIIVSAIVWKRYRLRRAQHPPFVQPFSSQPASFIARLLTYPSMTTLDIKGRRRLFRPIEEPAHPGIIPPSKLAARRVSTALADSPHPTPEPTPVADVDNEGENVENQPSRRARTRGIQEEDSGLRMEQLEADGESSIVVMPPAYTAD